MISYMGHGKSPKVAHISKGYGTIVQIMIRLGNARSWKTLCARPWCKNPIWSKQEDYREGGWSVGRMIQLWTSGGSL